MGIKEHAIRFRCYGKIIYLFIFFDDNTVSKKRPKRQFKGVRPTRLGITNYILRFETREPRRSECVAQVSLIEFSFYTCTKTAQNNDNFNCFN